MYDGFLVLILRICESFVYVIEIISRTKHDAEDLLLEEEEEHFWMAMQKRLKKKSPCRYDLQYQRSEKEE